METILREIILLATKIGWSKHPIFIHTTDGSIGGIILGDEATLDTIEEMRKIEALVIPFPKKDQGEGL